MLTENGEETMSGGRKQKESRKMKVPDYISVEEVKRVCAEVGLRDWTALEGTDVPPKEAGKILAIVNVQHMPIAEDDFRQGLEVELEHGLAFEDANVTNNHPILTGKIVLAHLKESLDYYKRLDVAEIEGDLLKAAASGNAEKLMAKFRKLIAARRALAEAEAEQLAKSVG